MKVTPTASQQPICAKKRALPTQEAEKALSQEEEFLNSLSKDIWLLVLSKEQEDFLTISREEMGVIAQYRTGKEG